LEEAKEEEDGGMEDGHREERPLMGSLRVSTEAARGRVKLG
jgi:hypothetical protein